MDLHEADPKRFPDCFNSIAALSARVPEVLGKHYEITYPGRQMMTARNLRRGPLAAKWEQNSACFNQVYGWERPMFFGSSGDPVLTFGKAPWFDNVAKEVGFAHTGAAIFDQSTFGKISVVGADAEGVLNRICTNNMKRSPGAVIYTGMLNEQGGYESDLTAMRISDEKYVLFVGSAAVKRDMAWIKNQLLSADRVKLEDVTEDWAVIGLMGPDSTRIADDLGARELLDLDFFRHGVLDIKGIETRAARISYVGEMGWELTCAGSQAEALYDLLFAAGARPAGMYAQTSMRIEKRYLSYGHDLDTDTNPLQAGLEFAIDWESPFIGRERLLALREQDSGKVDHSQMVSILLDDCEANVLGNEPVYLEGRIVGQTTSGAFGYRVNRPVALAYVNLGNSCALDGIKVEVDVARQLYSGTLHTRPVFDPGATRIRQSNFETHLRKKQ
jgi:4-methylaminobutanoate oxidase (formaldehyde-forming)